MKSCIPSQTSMGDRWSLGMDNNLFHPTLYWASAYLYMLGIKLIQVSKRGPPPPPPEIFVENMYNFFIGTVPADSLASIDARASAGAVMTKIGSLVCKIPAGLTHWGRVTHICVGELTIIVSDNGLSSGRRQAIIGTNVGILLIGPHGTNFSEIEILTFSLTKMSLKVSSAKWRPFFLGLNVLRFRFRWILVVLHGIFLWKKG